jgi:hypothetical protein
MHNNKGPVITIELILALRSLLTSRTGLRSGIIVIVVTIIIVITDHLGDLLLQGMYSTR